MKKGKWINPDGSSSDFYIAPTKSEVDKLVEDHIEPAGIENLKKRSSLLKSQLPEVKDKIKDLIKKANRQVDSDLLKNPIVSNREDYPCSGTNEGTINILPTKDEVDKLVEDHIEPKIKFYDFSKLEDCEAFEKDYGKGSTLHDWTKRLFIGADIQKNGVSYSEGIDKHIELISKRKDWNKLLKKGIKEGKIVMVSTKILESEKDNFFYRQFMRNETNSSDYIKLKNDEELKWNPSAKRNELIDRDVYLKGVQCGLSESTIESLKHYHNFKKRKFSFKNLIMKVVKWWTE